MSYSASKATTPDTLHVVSVLSSSGDQSPPPSPINIDALDQKLLVAQSRLKQEDININAQELSEKMETKVGNIDQVRDLLFGGQIRDYDKRFKRLEDYFSQENLNFREEMFERIKVLEERLNTEIDSLAEKVKLERQEYESVLQNLELELKIIKNDLNKRITQMDDKFSYEFKTIRQQTHSKFQELNLQIRQQNTSLTSLIKQEVSKLQDEKVSRNDLAAFFNELVIHLTKNYDSGESSE
jgi:hypothetical protein